jgi:hypothetical protein
VYVKADGTAGQTIPELTGGISGTVRLGPQELASIADVTKAEAASAKSKDDVKITVRDCKVADNGGVSLKVEVERSGAGGGLGNAVVRRQVQIGGGGALMPGGVAQMVNAMQADGDSFRLFDAQSRPYTVSIGEVSTTHNNGMTFATYNLDCQPPDKGTQPRKLELHGPRRASVDAKFTLRQVPTP